MAIADYVGMFAVTTGIGADKKDAQFLAAHDDYSSILFKALALSLIHISRRAEWSAGRCIADAP